MFLHDFILRRRVIAVVADPIVVLNLNAELLPRIRPKHKTKCLCGGLPDDEVDDLDFYFDFVLLRSSSDDVIVDHLKRIWY
jgi:hypothetical protein